MKTAPLLSETVGAPVLSVLSQPPAGVSFVGNASSGYLYTPAGWSLSPRALATNTPSSRTSVPCPVVSPTSILQYFTCGQSTPLVESPAGCASNGGNHTMS